MADMILEPFAVSQQMMVTVGILFSFQLFLPILCKEFGWSRGMVGGAGSITMIVSGLVAPLSGLLTAKHGVKRAIVTGNILGILGLVLLSIQSRAWHLYAGFGILFGAGAGIGGMLPVTTLATNWFIKKRSLA
ncbi:MAG: MFS transporter [Pseudomonadota bacterium]